MASTVTNGNDRENCVNEIRRYRSRKSLHCLSSTLPSMRTICRRWSQTTAYCYFHMIFTLSQNLSNCSRPLPIIWKQGLTVVICVLVHFGGGFWGVVAVTLFNHDTGIFYTGFSGHAWRLFGWNLLGGLVITAWSMINAFLLFFTMNKVGVLRVSAEIEIKGGQRHVSCYRTTFFKHTAVAICTLQLLMRMLADSESLGSNTI